jgi:quinol monooxygenase YgiN
MFLLLAELAAKPAAANDVESILKNLADVARSESGNLVYAVHRQCEDPQRFVLYELYKDRAACDAHLASAPVQQALQRFEHLLDAPPRIVYCDTVAAAGIA